MIDHLEGCFACACPACEVSRVTMPPLRRFLSTIGCPCPACRAKLEEARKKPLPPDSLGAILRDAWNKRAN